MSALGLFSTQLHGKMIRLRNAQTAHEDATSVHGATSAATANRLILRDGSGRARVANPSHAQDIANKGYVDSQVASVPGGTVTSVSGGTDLTGSVTTSGSISHSNSGVSAGTYSLATITVNARGHVTSASSGSAITNVSGTSPVSVSSSGSTRTVSMSSATSSRHGYMTSTYAAKLNGIAAGAQVNTVNSVFGRTGNISAASGDYRINQISGVTISTSAPSGGQNGDLWFQY